MSHDVPFLHERDIEAEAELLLAEYSERYQPILEPPVPIEDIVELHLELIFEFKDLYKELGSPGIHGAIWINEQRIAVDEELDPTQYPAKRGRYHFTLAHETGHWRLHRKYFMALRVL